MVHSGDFLYWNVTFYKKLQKILVPDWTTNFKNFNFNFGSRESNPAPLVKHMISKLLIIITRHIFIFILIYLLRGVRIWKSLVQFCCHLYTTSELFWPTFIHMIFMCTLYILCNVMYLIFSIPGIIRPWAALESDSKATNNNFLTIVHPSKINKFDYSTKIPFVYTIYITSKVTICLCKPLKTIELYYYIITYYTKLTSVHTSNFDWAVNYENNITFIILNH